MGTIRRGSRKELQWGLSRVLRDVLAEKAKSARLDRNEDRSCGDV